MEKYTTGDIILLLLAYRLKSFRIIAERSELVDTVNTFYRMMKRDHKRILDSEKEIADLKKQINDNRQVNIEQDFENEKIEKKVKTLDLQVKVLSQQYEDTEIDFKKTYQENKEYREAFDEVVRDIVKKEVYEQLKTKQGFSENKEKDRELPCNSAC